MPDTPYFHMRYSLFPLFTSPSREDTIHLLGHSLIMGQLRKEVEEHQDSLWQAILTVARSDCPVYEAEAYCAYWWEHDGYSQWLESKAYPKREEE